MSMNLQNVLADLAEQFRRPGFWKAAAGQLAIAAGSSIVSAVAEEAEERARQAAADLDRLTVAVEEKGQRLRDLVVEAIADGAFDAEVVERARAIDAKHWANFEVVKTIPDDDPPEYQMADAAAADAELAAALDRIDRSHDWAGSGCRGVTEVHWPACEHRPDSRVCQHDPCPDCQTSISKPMAAVGDSEHAD